jgi:DNA repair protein RecO (recombination protein O)
MRHATRGVVLNYIKYQETSIIVRVFTELFGKQSYLVKGVRTAKPKHPIALFQPLMPLDLLVVTSRHSTLHHIVEATCHHPINNIVGNLKKAVIATFLTELFHKAVSEAEEGSTFFPFLLQATLALDTLEHSYELFYLRFMLSLTQRLGFGCTTANQINTELINSGYVTLSQPELVALDQLIQKKQPAPIIDKRLLRSLTQGLMHFLQLHVATLESLHSLKVLQSLNE